MEQEYARTLEALANRKWCDVERRIAEHEKRSIRGRVRELVRGRKITQGDAGLSFYRWDLSAHRKD
jgi:hypothetical protein